MGKKLGQRGQVSLSDSPSLHSRATLDSRLSICSCSRLRVRSASRDFLLYAISTMMMTSRRSPPPPPMPMMAGSVSRLSE